MNALITPGVDIIVEGKDLAGDTTLVAIDDAPVPVTAAENALVALTLPAGLTAGPHKLLITHGVNFGAPTGLRPGFTSNLAAFVIQPVIAKTAGQHDIAVTNVQGTGNAPRSATITIRVAPDVGPKQTATLELLGPQGVANTFMAPQRAASTSQLVFAAQGVTAGTYFFQVRIDGATSPLDLDAAGGPVAPSRTIP